MIAPFPLVYGKRILTGYPAGMGDHHVGAGAELPAEDISSTASEGGEWTGASFDDTVGEELHEPSNNILHRGWMPYLSGGGWSSVDSLSVAATITS
jgi:hypothetical protein